MFRRRSSSSSASFLAEQGKQRRYFYNVDLHGHLFTADTAIRNVMSCVKGEKVLAFFFKQLRPNEAEFAREYPWVSPCGSELNFVAAEDTPIVFADLLRGHRAQLTYAGGTLTEPFDAAALRMCAITGRLYHPLTTHRRLGGAPLMLIRSHLVSELEECIAGDDRPDPAAVDGAPAAAAESAGLVKDPGTSSESESAGMATSGLCFTWDGRRFPIRLMHHTS
jgi:hypothetical protein